MTPTVSVEFLKAQLKKKLGRQVEELIDQGREELMTQTSTPPAFKTLDKLIHDTIGLKVHTEIMETPGQFFVLSTFATANSGVRANLPGELVPTELKGKWLQGDVDFVQGRVSGFLAKLPMYVGISREILIPSNDFTTEEITGVYFHELGHQFFALASLGDYTALNYILTEGIQDMVNQRPTRHRLNLMDMDYLIRTCDDQTLKQHLQTDPSESHVRRAVLGAFAQQRRQQLGSYQSGALRNEQMADLFAARLGYARPLATALYKTEKRSRLMDSAPVWMMGETLRLLTAVGLAPLTLTTFAYGEFKRPLRDDRTYDEFGERIDKLRRDLVSRFRIQGPTLPAVYRREILQDIDTIESLQKTFKRRPDVLEALSLVFNPWARRDTQRREQEEQLEVLLNNDAFVTSARLVDL